MPPGIPTPKSTRCSTRVATPRRKEERKAHYFKVQEVLARDLPTLTIHQQAQIGVSGVQLRNQWKAANYQWWHQVWLAQ